MIHYRCRSGLTFPTSLDSRLPPGWRAGGVLGPLIAALALVGLLAGVVVWGALAGAGASRHGAPATATNAGGVLSPGASLGQAKYMSVCIACHGEHGEARPGLGKDLRESEFLDGLTDAEAVKFLMQGRGPSDALNTTGVQMPPKGGDPSLSSDDLANIVAFLRSLKSE